MERAPLIDRCVAHFPLVCAAAALIVLLLPLAVHAGTPPAAPGTGPTEMRTRMLVGRVLATMLSCAALGTLGARMRTHPASARRQAILLGTATLLVATAAALPLYDAAARETVEQTYAAHPAVEAMDDGTFRTYALEPANRVAPATVGPIPIHRGDEVTVTAYALGDPGASLSPPTLTAAGLACTRTTFIDGVHATRPHLGATWKCTATATGWTRLAIHDGTPRVRDYEVTATIDPVLYTGYLNQLGSSVATHAAGLSASSLALLVWSRRPMTTPGTPWPLWLPRSK